jgi:hypothetical protein
MPRQTSKAKESTPQMKDKALPPATPNPPLSPLIQSLRRDWRWASISQFLWTFGQAAGLSSWDIEVREVDTGCVWVLWLIIKSIFLVFARL